MIEAVVAILVVYFTINPARALSLTPGPGSLELFLSNSTVILGGVYILVRGPDNIGQSLPTPRGLQRL
jgi:hypothetical protein